MPIDESIVQEYWRAMMGEETEIPPLNDDPVEMFKVLLLGPHERECAPSSFRLQAHDPLTNYAGIAVFLDPSAEIQLWAADIAELIRFHSPAQPHYQWYLDTIPDSTGHHRVYACLGTSLLKELASIDDALRWMTGFVNFTEQRCDQHATEAIEAALAIPHPWSQSGTEVFAKLCDTVLPDLYQAWSQHSWPESPIEEILTVQPPQATGPGATRMAMLATIESVMRSRTLDTKNVDYTLMCAAHRLLIDQLRQLSKAVSTGYPPKVVLEAARGEDPLLAEAAQTWLLRFQDSEDHADQALASPVADETRALRQRLSLALAQLMKEEMIEVEPPELEPLLDELSMAVLEAHNPNHALKKLRNMLLHSDHVAEIYAADAVLEDVFRQALGG